MGEMGLVFLSFKADLLECSAMSDREYSILELGRLDMFYSNGLVLD